MIREALLHKKIDAFIKKHADKDALYMTIAGLYYTTSCTVSRIAQNMGVSTYTVTKAIIRYPKYLITDAVTPRTKNR